MNDYEREHLERLRKLAPECMVLLRKNGDFPLEKPGKIALFGSGARHTVKGGTGSGDVNARFVISVEEGLERAGFTVTSKGWLACYDQVRETASERFYEEIRQEAKEKHQMPILIGMGRAMAEPEYLLPRNAEGDTAVYVLARNSGEGSDRRPIPGDVLLTETEIRDILAIRREYTRFLLVLNVGGPVDLSPLGEVENILLLSQLGAGTGDAFADVLLGRAVPSGKLSTTWAAWEDYPTVGEYIQPDDTRYREGIYVGYRWFDTVGQEALFPFGFGLSYTDFHYGKPSVALRGSKVTVNVPVKNSGSFPGKEIVQVYVSVPAGKLDQPWQTLAAFGKTALLEPGKRETLRLTFSLEELASFDEEASAWVLEPGRYVIRVGADSRSTVPAALVELNERVVLRQVKHVGGRPDFTDWKSEAVAEALPAELPVLKAEASAFSPLPCPKPAVPSDYARGLVSGLDEESLLRLCLGQFSGSGLASVIGSASQSVAGAAGETYGGIPGLPGLVMADGPAGLRLSRQYTRDAKGAHAIGSTMPADMAALMPAAVRHLMKLTQSKPKGKVYEQYCSSIPIGTALAQSWNPAVAEACGDLVGREMEIFGIQLWLAPAFNIHRTILCGRNFEYYAEDPLLAGRMAAGMTRGVQRHPGCGVTVKHFCCNNQELHRMTSNSLVSERALREIYLRAFEICIREADPAALMTSYNLLNGEHTSQRADLLQTLLREEWGYRGLLMTDWVVAQASAKGRHAVALSAPSIAAGNIFMPGSLADLRLALKALRGQDKRCALSRREAERCAAQVVDCALRLKT